MIRRALVVLILVPLVAVHVFLTGRAGQERQALPVDVQTPAFLPGPALRLSALEYKGVVADFLLLKAMVFLGATHERTTVPRVTAEEWQWVLGVLKATVALDPPFFDPYYLANANLVWDGGLVKEANELVEKGCRARPWDWLLPFYLGFNHFYFLEDEKTAADRLMEASRKPGAPALVATLASRLAYEGARTAKAVTFLEELLANEKDEEVRKEYRLRLEALRGVARIEEAAAAFTGKFGGRPTSVEQLIRSGILLAVPADPYGGKFYIDGEGNIRTTSDLRFAQK